MAKIWRYAANELDFDLYEVIDHNFELRRKLENAIDTLTLIERDVLSARHGILEYVSTGSLTFQKIAILHKKSYSTIRDTYVRASQKLRNLHDN